MANWTLANIRQKTRQLSGRLSLTDLSNVNLDEYINFYMQYEFPAEFKINRNYTTVQVTLKKNVSSYAFPLGYTNFVPEATVDRVGVTFYQEPDVFYSQNLTNISTIQPFTSGSVSTPYSTTITVGNRPIRAGSVLIDDGTEVGVDDEEGNLVSDVTSSNAGTINYTTGALTYTFDTTPSSPSEIKITYELLPVGRPHSVLMADHKFTMYPTPDRAYRLFLKAWSNQTVVDTSGNLQELFVDATDRPRLDEWGPAIAFGAARRIVSDYGEMDRYQELTMLYEEQCGYVQTRTMVDLESTRAKPEF